MFLEREPPVSEDRFCTASFCSTGDNKCCPNLKRKKGGKLESSLSLALPPSLALAASAWYIEMVLSSMEMSW